MKGMAIGLAVALVAVVTIHADGIKQGGDTRIVKGKLKNFDKGFLVVTVGENDQEFYIDDNTKLFDKNGEPTVLNIKNPNLPNFLMSLSLSKNVSLSTVVESKSENGRDVAISVRLPLTTGNRQKAAKRALDSLIGKPLPPFKMTDTRGNVFTNADIAGKVVLIEFWATWCGPCMKTSPIIQGLHDKYAKRGLTVIGASVETDKENEMLSEKLDKYAKDLCYTYTILFNADELAKSCGIPGVPTTLIVDREGCIRDVQGGLYDAEVLRSKLDKAINSLIDCK